MSVKQLTFENLENITCGQISPASLYFKGPPTGYAHQSPMNYFEESVPFSYTSSGASLATFTGTLSRLNSIITMKFDTVSAASSGVASAIAFSTIDTRFRPGVDTYAQLMVMSNSTMVLGTLKIGSNGICTLYTGVNSNFSASGNNGIYAGVVTFCM